MRRRELEHAIREVGRRTNLDYFYVIGSAAVFASIPAVSDTAVAGTRYVDVIPAPADASEADALADKIDFVLGEGSDFDVEYGFYIQGVDHSTPAFAPKNWRERAIPVRSEGFTGLCMEIHDLALSKYGAGREKDVAATRALAQGDHTQKRVLLARLQQVNADQARLELMRARIHADFN